MANATTMLNNNSAICKTCGTQFDMSFEKAPDICRMCLDPRQFISAYGQAWTSLVKMSDIYKNSFEQDATNPHIWSIFSRPQFAIGQRAILIETPSGNVLWDCISFLDQETVDFIESRGGLKAIAISHPHFYTSHLTWAHVFRCPVYLANDDQEWLNTEDIHGERRFVDGETHEILPGVTMVKLGGHFPGSSVLHWSDTIFTGDTIGISLSGLNLASHTDKHQVFFFHYAFPNFIPLGPNAMHTMWKRLRPWDFHTVHSLFNTTYVRHPHAKRMVLESMKLQARHQEHEEHPLLKEQWA